MAQIDALAADLAREQYGVISTTQLLRIGFTHTMISDRVAEGFLTPVFRGVHRLGVGPSTERSLWMAGVLAGGPEAKLSHSSAARLFDAPVPRKPFVEITVPHARRRSRMGLRIHTSRRLEEADSTVVDGIPVTSYERTLLDIARDVRPAHLLRAYEHGIRRDLIDHARLEELATRRVGHLGTRALRRLFGYDATAAAETRSELEREFWDLVQAAGLPPYQRNVVVAGREVDAYWPEVGLVVEIQSRAWHTDHESFEDDHEKFAALKRAGLDVLGVTKGQIRERPTELVATLARLTDPSRVAARAA